MIIAISAAGKELSAEMDQRFGRAKHFILFDTEKNETTTIDNEQNLNAPQGAGIQSAQNVINAGADAVITGHTGPKAFNLLTQGEVKVYYSTAQTVREAVDSYLNGEMTCAETADVEGHWV